MIDKSVGALLLILMVCLVQGLATKRASLKIKTDDYKPSDEQSEDFKNILKARDDIVEEENGEAVEYDENYEKAVSKFYFDFFKKYIDRRFKFYEDELFDKLDIVEKASYFGKMRTNDIANSGENFADEKELTDEEARSFLTKMKIKSWLSKRNEANFENKNEAIADINKYKTNDNEINSANYLDQPSNDVSEEGSNVGENSKNTKNEDSEIDDYGENGALFEDDGQDRKDEEFGMLDYLVVSKESRENNVNKLFKYGKDLIYDGAFIPDDYFDNSDYEA